MSPVRLPPGGYFVPVPKEELKKEMDALKQEAGRRLHERVDAKIETWSQELERGWYNSKSGCYVSYTRIERLMFLPLMVTFSRLEYTVRFQEPIGHRRVDCLITNKNLEARMAVEFDTKKFHKPEDDRSRDEELRGEHELGTIRLREEDIIEDPWACSTKVYEAFQEIESRKRNEII